MVVKYFRALLTVALLLPCSLFGQAVEYDAADVRSKAAKLLIVGLEAQSLSPKDPIVEDIRERGISGVILFRRNLADADGSTKPREQLTKFVADLKALREEPLIVALDQEGGLVNRLPVDRGFEAMASHKSVGRRGDDDYTRQVAATIASEVASVGFNLNFAPCVDVDINPECPVIGHFGRSFSADESVVTHCAEIYVEEHHKRSVLTSLKHFPGHGSSLKDSHFGLTDITATWQERELSPYQSMIESGECDAVMVSHLFHRNFDTDYPATLSKKIINGLLRTELGWSGVVITDDMQMRAITDHYGFEEAVVLGLNAGVDLFIVGNNITQESYPVAERFIEIVESAVSEGRVDISTLNQAVVRVKKFVGRLE